MTITYQTPIVELPLWNSDMPQWQPCRYDWQPALVASHVHAKTGRVLVEGSELPPYEWNVQEIHVQSRKVAGILCNMPRPRSSNPIVRILPPTPVVRAPSMPVIDVLVCAPFHDDRCSAILRKTSGTFATNPVEGMIACSETVVYPFDAVSSLDHLAVACGADCNVVASDAGATEEYLTMCAMPGTWHVVRTGRAADYVAAINELASRDMTFRQVNKIDNEPFLEW